MSPFAIKVLSVGIAALFLYAAARLSLGPVRSKDRLLLAGLTVVGGFLGGGIVSMVTGESGGIAYLAIGLILGLGVIARLRAAGPRTPPA